MTESVYVDTAYLVALLSRRDVWHERAVELAREWDVAHTALVSSDAIMTELANFFARRPERQQGISFITRIRATRGWTVIGISAGLQARAEALYASHSDKQWSLTDCISMEAMRGHGITACATTDEHFVQAGFRALLR